MTSISLSATWRKNHRKKAQLALAMTAIFSTETFAAAGGFSNLPLNIERSLSDTVYGTKRVNPNVMFLIDDTGSMRTQVDGSGGKSRIVVTREAMIKLADKHRDGLNYYVLDLCGTSRQAPKIGQPLNHVNFKNIIRNMYAYCGDTTDHSIEGYYDALYFLRKNMNEADGQYRCQKNFLLYFGDGESNPTRVAWDNEGVAYAQESSMYDKNRSLFSRIKAETNGYWDCTIRTTFQKPVDSTGLCRYAHLPDWRKYSRFQPASTSSGDSKVFNESIFRWGVTNYVGFSVLAGPADWVGNNDLVTATSAKKPTDAAGKSWDDPDFPMQTIGTYSVGLGVQGGQYLDGAAGSAEAHKAILAQTPDGLFNALDKILTEIREKSKMDIPDSYSYTSPASLGGEKLDSAVGVHLLEGTTRSQLRFFKYDHVTRKFETQYTTPTLPALSDKRFAQPSNTPNRPVLTFAKNQYFFLNDPAKYGVLNNSDFGLDNTHANQDEFKLAMIPWITLSADDSVQRNDEHVNSIAQLKYYPYPKGINKGDRYRVRTAVKGKHPNEYYMGDILDAPVVAGGQNIDNLPEFLFTSANDGLSYVFKRQRGRAGEAPYSLILRYFPMEMDRDTQGHTIGKEMNHLRRTDYAVVNSNYPHQWMNNGGVTVRSMSVRQPKDSRHQYSMVVATPGQAGRGLFALSLGGKDFFTGKDAGLNDAVTAWTKSIPLFETPKKAENDLGYILGNPSVARLSLCRQNHLPGGRTLNFDSTGTVKCDTFSAAVAEDNNADYGVVYTTLYGNGYRHPDNIDKHDDPMSATKDNVKSALHVRLLWNKDVGLKSDGSAFAHVAPNGLLIRKIEVDNYSGLSMPVAVDMDFDGIVDLAYAATYDGELYRFDFRADSPSQWTAHKIFSTQTVPYQYLEHDTNGVLVDASGTPKLLTQGTTKQKVMMAPDIFRMEHKGTDGKIKLRYMISFGTGSNVFSTDLYDRSLQSTYSIEDRPDEEKNPTVIPLDKLIKREFIDDLAKGLRDVKPRPSIGAPDPSVRGWYANFTSTDKFGLPLGERMVASPIMIKNMVLNNTVFYEFARNSRKTSGSGADLCLINEDKSSITNAGWVLGLNPINGDSTSPRDTSSSTGGTGGTGTGGTGGTGAGNKSMVGLDGLNKSQDDGSGGVGKMLKGVTNYTLFHRRQSLDTPSSVTDNGGLLSGLDPELKSMDVPRNDCMTRPEAESIRLIGQSKDGLDDSLHVIPNICPTGGGLLRLNLRPVPL